MLFLVMISSHVAPFYSTHAVNGIYSLTQHVQYKLNFEAVRIAHNVLNTYSWAELRCTVVSFEFVFENCRYWLGYQFLSDPYYSLKMFIFENDKVVDEFNF